MIEINHVRKSFGDKTVLDDVTLSVSEGSIYGLVGYNGAGKTTLLSLIAGLYRPDQGNITADIPDGKLTAYGSEAVRRDLFFIPDDPYILPQANLNTMASFYRGFYPNFSMETYRKLTELFGLDPKKTHQRLFQRHEAPGCSHSGSVLPRPLSAPGREL